MNRLHCFVLVLNWHFTLRWTDQTRHPVFSETLSSYMSCSSVKALAALKHVTSYLDGTPDSGMLLKVTQEGKFLSDFWGEDDLVQSEAKHSRMVCRGTLCP